MYKVNAHNIGSVRSHFSRDYDLASHTTSFYKRLRTADFVYASEIMKIRIFHQIHSSSIGQNMEKEKIL